MVFRKHTILPIPLALCFTFCLVTLGSKTPNKDELFQLAVKEAKRLGIGLEPEAKTEIDRVLYKHYLKSILGQHADELQPTDKEVRRAYATAPRIRLRHLAVMGKPAAQEAKIASVLAGLKSGKSFKQLVLQYSEDAGAKFAGDLDFKGKNDLPSVLYAAALRLKPGQVSIPIKLGAGTHLVEVIAVQEFAKAPEVYKAFLRGDLKHQKELTLLRKNLASLALRKAKYPQTKKDTK
ncbi:MAG: peptidylprolyl isomerase [Bdellovibrionales bacterium]|nr:peptidylprolyl isomerase [Bdellovibrionales bacterium]